MSISTSFDVQPKPLLPKTLEILIFISAKKSFHGKGEDIIDIITFGLELEAQKKADFERILSSGDFDDGRAFVVDGYTAFREFVQRTKTLLPVETDRQTLPFFSFWKDLRFGRFTFWKDLLFGRFTVFPRRITVCSRIWPRVFLLNHFVGASSICRL